MVSLRYDLRGVEFFSLIFLPVALTVGTAYLLSFLPINIYLVSFSFIKVRLWDMLLLSYIVLMYMTLLSENIFNVAAIRTIPLLKAAHTVAYLISVMTSFLIYTAIYKPNLAVSLQLLLVFVVSTLLVLQYLWSLTLEERLPLRFIVASLIIGYLITQLTFSISFFPLKSFLRALVLSTAFYVGLGVAQNYFRESLTKYLIMEYLFVSLAVSGVLFLLH